MRKIKRKKKYQMGKLSAWIMILCLMSVVLVILLLQQPESIRPGEATNDDKAVHDKSELKPYLVAASSIYTEEESTSQKQGIVTSVTSEPNVEQPSKNGPGLKRASAKDIINYAKQFLNVKYVWGGISPRGFDCSGFVKYVFDKFGYKLNRIAADQAKDGVYVKKADLQPGNLVFFDTNNTGGNINHVGIFIGEGNFIQASSIHSKVMISKISDGIYKRTFVTARKIESQ